MDRLSPLRIVLICLLLVGGGCATHPGDETAMPVASFPVWREGAHWVYDDGYELQVTEVNGAQAKFERLDEANRWFARQGFLTVHSFDGEQERKLLALSQPPQDFAPLAVGKVAIFTRRSLTGQQERMHHHSWLVEGQERITVPAGSFDCWVILFAARSTQSNWRSFERWWYSPQINHYVRLDYQYGDSPVLTRQLLSFRQEGTPH